MESGRFAELARTGRHHQPHPPRKSSAPVRRQPPIPSTENDLLLAYSKSTPDRSNVVLIVANCDPHHVQRGMVTLPLQDLDLELDGPYQAHELLSGARYQWQGPRNYVEINPFSMPAQIFRFRHRVRREHDFEYFA
ncbi:MAG TPA: hypothetical protein VNA65_01260 [Candidatus Dormibacteraeota bacterium]|nr:hypothetical protein [Candidatus Dormibacteraeota bacterium]